MGGKIYSLVYEIYSAIRLTVNDVLDSFKIIRVDLK